MQLPDATAGKPLVECALPHTGQSGRNGGCNSSRHWGEMNRLDLLIGAAETADKCWT